MSYLFCALVYNRKCFDPGLIVEIMSEEYEPEDDLDAFVKVPVKGSVEAVFMLPLRKDGNKSQAFLDRIEFIEDGFVELLGPALAAGRGGVNPRFMPVVFLVAYSDMSPHQMIWTISPEGVDYRAAIEGEGHHSWMPKDGEDVEQHEDISVNPADFGATDESDKDFREDEYHAEVERKKLPFAIRAVLEKELQITTGQLLDATHQLDKGETIWPEKEEAPPPRKAAAGATKSAAGKKSVKSKPAGKR